MKDNWRRDQLPLPEYSEDPLDGFGSHAILAFVIIGPLTYVGPQLAEIEAWFVDICRSIDSWVAPIREFVVGWIERR